MRAGTGVCNRYRFQLTDRMKESRRKGLALKSRGNGFLRRFDALADEVVDLGPDPRIAFALHVISHKSAIKPRSSITLHRSLLVIEPIVADDLGFRVIFGANLRASVDEAMRLVEIDGSCDVIGNDVVVLPRFRHAVDLHGEQDWNARLIQLAREEYDSRSSPTMAEEDDAGVGLFFFAQSTVMIVIQKMENGVVSGFAMTVLEDPNKGILGKLVPRLLRKNHRALMGIIVADEAPDESDKDVRGRDSWPFDDTAIR